MARGLLAKIVLTALAVLVCVDDAEAGRRRRRGGGDCCCESGSGGGGYSYGGGGSGYSMSGYSNMYASGGSSCGCQSGGGGGYVSSYPMPMGGGQMPMGGGYAQGGYTTGYGDMNQFGAQGGFVQYSQATGGAIASDKSRLHVRVPSAEARLWINNQQIQVGGAERALDIAVAAGQQQQKYTLTVQWVKDGREVVRKKEVEIRPGQETTVTFSDSDQDAAVGNNEQLPVNPNPNQPIPPSPNQPKRDNP
jgi:uncharacterized protein (TIGR03000 family)